jgi:hypothetical protein
MDLLRRRLFHLQWVAHAACFVTLALIPLMLYTLPEASSSIPLLFLFGVYLVRKAWRAHQSRHTLKQIQIENLYVQHALARGYLQRCANHQSHLTQASVLSRGLEAVYAPSNPYPSETQEHEFMERIQQALATLAPPRINYDFFLLAVAGLLWAVATSPIPTPYTPQVHIGSYALILLLLFEVMQTGLHWRMFANTGRLASALWTWMSSESILVSPHEKHYGHNLIYRATPLFAETHPAS